jgi:hypothetical protein
MGVPIFDAFGRLAGQARRVKIVGGIGFGVEQVEDVDTDF